MRRWAGRILLTISFDMPRQRNIVNERRRWESNPQKTALQAAARPSGIGVTRKPSAFRFQRSAGIYVQADSWKLIAESYPKASSPGVEPGLRPSQGRVRIHHTPRTNHVSAPRRGIEPRPADSKSAVRSRTLAGRLFQRPDLESNQGQGLRSALCDPLHHRDVFSIKSRRLDLHQHKAVYKTAASLFGHIGFFQHKAARRRFYFSHKAAGRRFYFSTSARIRTPCDGFGDRLLSHEHTRVSALGLATEGLWRNDYSRSVTFQ
jgi:hypothetical protein